MEIVFAKEGITFRIEVELPTGKKIVEDTLLYSAGPLDLTLSINKIEPVMENGTLKAIRLNATDVQLPQKQSEIHKKDKWRIQKTRAAERKGQAAIDRIIKPMQPISKHDIVTKMEEMNIAHGGYTGWIVDGLAYLGRIEKRTDGKYIVK